MLNNNKIGMRFEITAFFRESDKSICVNRSKPWQSSLHDLVPTPDLRAIATGFRTRRHFRIDTSKLISSLCDF